MDKDIIRKYAKLAVRVGVNLQEGQGLVIYASVDQEELVGYITQEAYAAGAQWVRAEWSSQLLTKLGLMHQSVETLSTVHRWQEDKLRFDCDELPCEIHIISEDPDGLKGTDPNKQQTVHQNRYKIIKKYRDESENKQQWTIIAAPSEAWANKVFPEAASAQEAKDKLWEAILRTVYVTSDNDPIAAWQEHNRCVADRCRCLNECGFERIEYKSANGTDFTAWLIPTAQWQGGMEHTLSGKTFNPNMPSEEIFTSPMKGRAEGRLVAVKPLSYKGEMIEDFWVDFNDGRATAWGARRGQEMLGNIITMDDGSAMLGELALVSKSSPIAKAGIIFYETLFDENASCHVALGQGFSHVIQGFEDMTKEQTDEIGINDSIVHVDFMIGADDINITGYRPDGSSEAIFIDGEWALTGLDREKDKK